MIQQHRQTQIQPDLLGRIPEQRRLLRWRAVSLQIVKRFSPASGRVADVIFETTAIRPLDIAGKLVTEVQPESLWEIRRELEKFFTPALGFGRIDRLNYTDGVRIYFSNGDVAHVRPSGNADELRIYAVADTQARADAITASGVAEPDGILRKLENLVDAHAGFAAK